MSRDLLATFIHLPRGKLACDRVYIHASMKFPRPEPSYFPNTAACRIITVATSRSMNDQVFRY